MEPSGPDRFVVEDVFLVKNRVTELTYAIFFEITAGDATKFLDYEEIVDRALLDFPPSKQRFQVFGDIFRGDVDLDLEIYPDALPEGTETVEISVSPVSSPPPAYTRPSTGAVTTLYILDNDSKNLVFSIIKINVGPFLTTDITVGWDQTSYTVSEGVGVLQACYSVVQPPNTGFNHLRNIQFFMGVTTTTGTAGDY